MLFLCGCPNGLNLGFYTWLCYLDEFNLWVKLIRVYLYSDHRWKWIILPIIGRIYRWWYCVYITCMYFNSENDFHKLILYCLCSLIEKTVFIKYASQRRKYSPKCCHFWTKYNWGMGGIRVFASRAPPLIERFYSTQERPQGGDPEHLPRIVPVAPDFVPFVSPSPRVARLLGPPWLYTFITVHTSKNQTLIWFSKSLKIRFCVKTKISQFLIFKR